MLNFRYLYILFIFILNTTYISSQVNTHYWSHQYGSKGLLLNGAIIATVEDETAIFYNPGAMSMTDNFGISVSLITPTFSLLKTTDFLGKNTSFTDKKLGLAPGLIAAMVRPFKSERLTIGITTFKRFHSDVDFHDRIVKTIEGEEVFLGDVSFNRSISETWAGVGLSFKAHPKLAFGISNFFTFRSENLSLNLKKEILEREVPENIIASWRSDFTYGYSANGGMITKFGISWQPYGIKLGFTATTATYALIHKSADYAFDDQKIFTNQTNTSSSNNRSVQLQNYFTPYSLGFGLEIPMGKGKLSISGEYFNKVARYNLIDDTSDPLDGLSSNPKLTTVKISEEKDQVINLAIGVEKKLNTKYSWFYGFRTDFSPNSLLDLGEGISFLASTPSIYHISTGGAYAYRRSLFSIGLDYGIGFKSGGKQLTDISNVTTDNIFAFSGDGSVKTVVHQFSLFITYDL